tara:strand:- start:7384 stop:7650 length:267 start_codon:yes stop_codon:yes gene_type:complete
MVKPKYFVVYDPRDCDISGVLFLDKSSGAYGRDKKVRKLIEIYFGVPVEILRCSVLVSNTLYEYEVKFKLSGSTTTVQNYYCSEIPIL